MATDILLQGKTFAWDVDDQGAALVSPKQQTLRLDVSGSTSYIGVAPVGAVETAAVWQIRRMVVGSDGDVTITWADGDAEYDNVWADRASLSYS